MGLEAVPMTFEDACEYIGIHHRTHEQPAGHKFCVGVADPERLVGVAIVGRPVSRHFDDGDTLEVTRTCTDGTRNANSFLYGTVWRAAKALGYRRLITYTQDGESGASLVAAGWRVVAQRPPRSSWAEASVQLKHLRNPVGNGGVARTLWQAD